MKFNTCFWSGSIIVDLANTLTKQGIGIFCLISEENGKLLMELSWRKVVLQIRELRFMCVITSSFRCHINVTPLITHGKIN
jgi:hypothetical protein